MDKTYRNFYSKKGLISETFNNAFKSKLYKIRQRAIFANGEVSSHNIVEDAQDSFYIFPVDGYKFIYSKEVENSTEDYKQVIESVFGQFGEQKGKEVVTDLLRFSYTSKHLAEGILSGSEIVVYGIPFYYAVRSSSVDNYSDMLTLIHEA